MKTKLLFAALLLMLPSILLADGDINMPLTLGSTMGFNIGPVAEVSVSEVIFTGDASFSYFDCEGNEVPAAPGIYVQYDDEGLPSIPPSIQYACFAGDLDLTLPVHSSDPNGWNILDDGTAGVTAETWVHTELQGCTLVTEGHINIDGNQVLIHLVYTNIVGEETHHWSEIKTRYR